MFVGEHWACDRKDSPGQCPNGLCSTSKENGHIDKKEETSHVFRVSVQDIPCPCIVGFPSFSEREWQRLSHFI